MVHALYKLQYINQSNWIMVNIKVVVSEYSTLYVPKLCYFTDQICQYLFNYAFLTSFIVSLEERVEHMLCLIT